MSKATEIPYVLLKEKETAQWLAVEVNTLRRWRYQGQGPRFIRLMTAVRYHPDDVMAFIAAGRCSSTRGPDATSDGL